MKKACAPALPSIASETAFPSLGPGPAPAPVPKPVALNYKKTVEITAARDEQERLAAAAAREAAASKAAAKKKQVRSTTLQPRRHIPSHCYDDGPLDDEVQEEEEDERPDEPDESEEEAAGEFNAHLQSGRRRGDKGIW